jgi:hypothetical protein
MEFPIIGVTVDKILKDTGQPGRPFFAKVCQTMKIRFLGLLVYRIIISGNFPEIESKK